MALELDALWCIGTSGVVRAAAAPDGVCCLVWGTASSTFVGGLASTFLDPLDSTNCGEGSTTPRGSAGPPCARRAGVPHPQEQLNLVSCTWRHSSRTSHQKTSEASPDHAAAACHWPPPPHSFSPLGSNCQHVRSSISPEHDHYKWQNRTLAVPLLLSGWRKRSHRQAASIAQLGDPLVFPHHTSTPNTTWSLSSCPQQLCLLVPPCHLTPSTPSVSLVALLLTTHLTCLSDQFNNWLFTIALYHQTWLTQSTRESRECFHAQDISCTVAFDADGYTTTKTVIYTNQCRDGVILWPRFHEAVCLSDYLFAHSPSSSQVHNHGHDRCPSSLRENTNHLCTSRQANSSAFVATRCGQELPGCLSWTFQKTLKIGWVTLSDLK